LKTDSDTDRNFAPCDLRGVAFYYTREPNVFPDISGVKAKKEQALRYYQA